VSRAASYVERVASAGETEQLMLTRPRDWHIEQAGDPGGKAAESQRLFRRRLPTERLWTVEDRCVERVASVGETEQLMLMRPCDRCIEEAGDTDSARQPTIDSSFDEAWRKESQRYRHADVTLAARLLCGYAIDRRGTGLDFGQPLPSPRDCADELDPGIGADREDCGS
jgi:hypothetical protein